MELPEVTAQPPAKQINDYSNNKDLPCGWSVVIDCGKWDKPIFEGLTKSGAEIYFSQALTFSDGVKIKLKPTNQVRRLHEIFVNEDILIRMDVS